MTHWQEQVFSNTEQRGYLRGWTFQEFALRQAVKLLEEVTELFLAFTWPKCQQFDRLRVMAQMLNEDARRIFDDKQLWQHTRPHEAEIEFAAVMGEIADNGVVLANLLQSLNTIGKTKSRLERLALDKSNGDISRGVR